MTTVLLTRNAQGKLVGLGGKDERAYAMFRARVEAMGPGELIEFHWYEPRSPVLHRKFFAMLHELFDAQGRFDDVDRLRDWVTVGAGYCELVPQGRGEVVAVPKSIAWCAMEEPEFRELVRAVWKFLRSERAQEYLWPHVPAAMRAEGVEWLLGGSAEQSGPPA
jgi:hypothetical protein